MGYAKTVTYGDSFTFGGQIFSNIEVTSVSANKALGVFSLPVNVEVSHAYLDLHVGLIQDDSGAGNYLNQNCSVMASGGIGGPQTGFTIPSGSFIVGPNGYVPGAVFIGNNNIKESFNGVPVTTIYLSGARSLGDSLWLYNVQVRVRLILA
jgi:hypothetical protein